MCDGVLYRSTYYQDEKVYEIVSDVPDESAPAEPTSVVGLSLTDPYTRGEIVRDLQNRLVGAGYDVGSVDGVFGNDTDSALQWFQYDNGLESTGVVDTTTAEKLGFLPSSPPATPAAEPETAAESDAVSSDATATPDATAPADSDTVPDSDAPADGDPAPEAATPADGDPVPEDDEPPVEN
jgi:peptidoglycan hydrolase-like protein with peptidoglycan-binding domain